MPRGLSIHVGLNAVDPSAYGGWDGRLAGCINDAQALRAIAESRGFTPTVLLDGQATALGVTRAIARAAQELAAGDTLLLTYSGHGGQVPDVNGDEPDGRDETWVLYDRMLVDDELYQLWSQFQADVRILMLSDSCHSGTVARDPAYQQRDTGDAPVYRAIPPEIQELAYQQHTAVYDTAQWIAGSGDHAPIAASIILISGCQDNQLAADGKANGLFTETLLQVWNGGRFTGGHYKLWKEIVRGMPATQSPNYYTLGRSNPAFEDSLPLTLDGVGPVTAGPSVRGPESWSRDGAPPGFDVTAGAGRYYVFEIATRPELFDITGHGAGRTADSFYGSWSDGPHLSAPRYQLPRQVWDRLAAAPRLYYRIGTTSSASGWDDYQVTTADDQGPEAPSVRIVGAATGPTAPPPTRRAAPSVRAPELWFRAEEPPAFDVAAGPGRYYVLEVATRPELLDLERHGAERTPFNFYATWSDSPPLTHARYRLPERAWQQLRQADRLFYRIGTTSSPGGYDDYAVSVPDDQGSRAPAIHIL
jgi:hypothetical protein